MKTEIFNEVVKRRLEQCQKTLIRKSDEYASDEDRLHNFKVAARMRNISPVKALDGMMIKHLVSMVDMINRMDTDDKYIPSQELVSEKLGDVINYTLLLECLIAERRIRES